MPGVLCLAGLLLLAVSWSLRNDSWWPGVLTEAGVAVLLFGPLLLVGRGIERALDTVHEAQRHTEEQQQDLAEHQRQTESDVTNLKQRVDNLIRARSDESAQMLDTLSKDPSFDAVTKALQLANDMNVLADGIATVQGGTDPENVDPNTGRFLSIRVRFLWGRATGAQQPSLLVQAVCDEDQWDWAQMGSEPEHRRNNNDRLCYQLDWLPEQGAEEVGFQIAEALTSKNLYRGGASTFDWDKAISEELPRTIAVAVESRRGGGQWWPIAPLFELVGDDWAITTVGVEYKHAKNLAPIFLEDEFPARFPGGDDYENEYVYASSVLHSPSGVPEPSERLLIRAKAHLPVRPDARMPTGWQPIRTSN